MPSLAFVVCIIPVVRRILLFSVIIMAAAACPFVRTASAGTILAMPVLAFVVQAAACTFVRTASAGTILVVFALDVRVITRRISAVVKLECLQSCAAPLLM